MSRFLTRRAVIVAGGTAALASPFAAPLPAMAQAAPPAPQITGFRSARFDMTEAQVRKAIDDDFKLKGAQVAKQYNKLERTNLLGIKVPDLIPDTGLAQVNYKLGYKSKKLTQVDLIWGPPIDPKVTPQAMNSVIVNLRQYWQDRGFPKDKMIVNAATQQPNIVLLFRGEDARGRVVALIGQFKVDGAAEAGKRLLSDQPEAVILSYILDSKAPDVYRIEPGKF